MLVFKIAFYPLVPDTISIVEVKSQKMFEIQDMLQVWFCVVGFVFFFFFPLKSQNRRIDLQNNFLWKWTSEHHI